MKKNQLLALGLLFLCVMAVSACTNGSALTGNTNWPGAAVEDDIIYASGGSFVEAVLDGNKLWSYPESANNKLSFFAAPAVDGDFVYVGTYSNQLHILNKADGSLVISAEVGNNKNKIIAAPVVADGKVFVLSSGGMVSAYPATGFGDTLAPLWQTTLSSEIWVKPVYAEGVLYVASMDKKMNLLDAETGSLIRTVEMNGAIMSDPVYADGKLYFSTLAKEVNEMDLATGAISVLLTTDGEIWASPLLIGDYLIAADMNGVFYAIDINTHETVKKSERITVEHIGFIASPAALTDDSFLLVDENGEIQVYDLEWNMLDNRSLSKNVYTTPVVLSSGSFVLMPSPADGTMNSFLPDIKPGWTYSRTEGGSTAAEPTAESGEAK